jgi:hypothetical protein
MPTTLLIFFSMAKTAEFFATVRAVPLVLPTFGFIIFFSAALLKDTVDRVGDFLDKGTSDRRDFAGYRPRAPRVRGFPTIIPLPFPTRTHPEPESAR